MSSSPELNPNPRRRRCAKTLTCFANAFAQVPWPAPNTGGQSSPASTSPLQQFYRLCSHLSSTPSCPDAALHFQEEQTPGPRTCGTGKRSEGERRMGGLCHVSKIVPSCPPPIICSNRVNGASASAANSSNGNTKKGSVRLLRRAYPIPRHFSHSELVCFWREKRFLVG